MKSQILFIAYLLIGTALYAQTLQEVQQKKAESQNPLFHKLGKAYKTPAFECEGWWVWGSSVIKGEDGKYHMFVSRFPKSLPFHPGWMVASEIVHATSDVPQGPYQLSDIALKRKRCPILGRTFCSQSPNFKKRRYLLFDLYGIYPPF